MDCINHGGVAAAAYCQSCGCPLCAACMRTLTGGQVLCEGCSTAWRPYQQAPPPSFYSSEPHPAAAAVLGVIPGVGAMYNGQFFKGLVHIAIFAILVSLSSNCNGVFGIFVFAWIVYQSVEAYRTARAIVDGVAPPDPLGLNEYNSWLNFRRRAEPPASNASGAEGGAAGAKTGCCGRAGRSFPVGGVVLIALGVVFLLGQAGLLSGRAFGLLWPSALIVLGLWLMVRRIVEGKGGPEA